MFNITLFNSLLAQIQTNRRLLMLFCSTIAIGLVLHIQLTYASVDLAHHGRSGCNPPCSGPAGSECNLSGGPGSSGPGSSGPGSSGPGSSGPGTKGPGTFGPGSWGGGSSGLGGVGDGAMVPTATIGPAKMNLHSVIEDHIDLRLSGPGFDWTHFRTYDSRNVKQGHAANTGNRPEGTRWHGGALGTYLRKTDSSSDYDIELYLNASSHLVFTHAGSGNFNAPGETALELKFSNAGTSSEEIRITNLDTGHVSIFYGFHSGIAYEDLGKLKETTTRAYEESGASGCTYAYHDDSTYKEGLVDTVVTPQGWLVDYDYDSNNQLIKVSVYDGARTSDVLLQRVEYSYFDHTDPTWLEGSLSQVKVMRRAEGDTGTNLSIVRITQYRYSIAWDTSQLTMIFESDAIQRIIDADGSDSVADADDVLALADTATINGVDLEEYASRTFTHGESGEGQAEDSQTTKWGTETLSTIYGGGNLELEYDLSVWQGVLKSESINGSCSSCGSGVTQGITKEYYYIELHDWYFDPEIESPPTAVSEPNLVVRIVVEDTVDIDGTPRYRTLYGVNYQGVAIRKVVIADADPDTSSHDLDVDADNVWCTSLILNDDWRVIERRMPSAHKGKVTSNATIKKFLDPYAPEAIPAEQWDNDDDTVNTGSGIVYYYEYDSNNKQKSVRVAEGAAGVGSSDFISATDWTNHAAPGKKLYLPDSTYVYDEKQTSRTSPAPNEVKYTYTFWDTDKTVVKQITTELPVISTAQNGAGGSVGAKIYQYFDDEGRLRWEKDGEGNVTYYSYHPNLGGLAYTMVDVETDDLPSDITTGDNSGPAGEDLKWIAWSGGVPSDFTNTDNNNLQLISKTEYDDQGRVTKTIDSGGGEHVTKYFSDGVARFPYVDGTAATLPVSVIKLGDAGQLQEKYSVDPSTLNVSTIDTLPSTTGDYVSRTVYNYDGVTGQLEQVDRYHDIDGSTGEGGDKQYYGTRYLYDLLGRRGATVQFVDTSKFQVTVNLFDVLGRIIETRRGAVSTEPTDYDALDNTSPATGYETISETVYDEGLVGDSFVTKRTQHHTTSIFTESTYKRTFRGHVRGVLREYTDGTKEDVKPYTVNDIDWMGRVTATAQYTTAPTWPTSYTDYVYDFANDEPETTGHKSVSVTRYDDLGRVYQTLHYLGTEATKHFEVNNYYDRNSRIVASGDKYSAHTEYAYDGAGRQYQQRTIMEAEGSYTSGAYDYVDPVPNPTLSSMSDGDNGVIVMYHTVYDDGGNVIEQHTLEMHHDDTTYKGIDLTADDDYVRRTVFNYYDDADRLTSTADYGASNGTSTSDEWKYVAVPSRPTSSPVYTDSNVYLGRVLLTEYDYHPDSGRQNQVTVGVREGSSSDTDTVKTKTFYDDLGRRTYVAENHNDFEGSTLDVGGGTNNEQDRVTGWEYNGLGQTIKLTAYNASSSTDHQETIYLFEDTYNASLLTNTIYPDSDDTTSSGTNQVKRTYNLDSSLATMTDQRKVKHTYSYNERRQLELDAATATTGTLDSLGVDDAIRSIGRTYDTMGRIDTITSYDVSSNVLNKIDYSYLSSHGQIYSSKQYHDATTYQQVIYSFTTDANGTTGVFENGLQLAQIRYPDNSKVYHTRGSSGDPWIFVDNIDGRLKRISHMRFLPAGGSVGTISEYKYNGTSRLAKVDNVVPDLRREMYSTSGNYDRWDRFGRTKTQEWEDYTGTATTQDQIDYTYDYAGNRLTRDILSSLYSTTDHEDQVFAYDGLHRLTSVEQGKHDPAAEGTIKAGTETFEQEFTLDQLGNWTTFKQDDNGNGTWDLDQSRDHNEANEIDDGTDNGITTTTGDNWKDPIHDDAGNMTTLPQPEDPTKKFELKYDAWNRVVEIKNNSGAVIQTNEYDGLNRRIVKVDTKGTTLESDDDTYDYYYNRQWQVMEIRKNGSTNPWKQYLYHPQFVDSVAMRRYDENTDGDILDTASGEGEHYYLQDANFNVTVITDSTGAVVERYSYSPYGEVTIFNASFVKRSPHESDIDNEYLYTGRRLDPETGLQLNRNRFYHSLFGRWVKRDPILYKGGTNLYQYVGTNPSLHVDAFGLEEQTTYPGIKPEFQSIMCKETMDRKARGEQAQMRLETLCDSKCLQCTKEECLAEAETIADAYKEMYNEKADFYGWMTNLGDRNNGWECYHWQTHTYNALFPLISKSKCFSMERVGFVGEEDGALSLLHNWIAISSIKKPYSAWYTIVKPGKDTIYLDPWWDGPCGYCHTGGSGYEDGHPTHNFVVADCVGEDPSKPTGVEGVYLLPDNNCTKQFEGWTWSWFWGYNQ